MNDARIMKRKWQQSPQHPMIRHGHIVSGRANTSSSVCTMYVVGNVPMRGLSVQPGADNLKLSRPLQISSLGCEVNPFAYNNLFIVLEQEYLRLSSTLVSFPAEKNDRTTCMTFRKIEKFKLYFHFHAPVKSLCNRRSFNNWYESCRMGIGSWPIW